MQDLHHLKLCFDGDIDSFLKLLDLIGGLDHPELLENLGRVFDLNSSEPLSQTVGESKLLADFSGRPRFGFHEQVNVRHTLLKVCEKVIELAGLAPVGTSVQNGIQERVKFRRAPNGLDTAYALNLFRTRHFSIPQFSVRITIGRKQDLTSGGILWHQDECGFRMTNSREIKKVVFLAELIGNIPRIRAHVGAE